MVRADSPGTHQTMTVRIMTPCRRAISSCPVLRLPGMEPEKIGEAFGAESRRLSEVVAGLDDAAFTRPTACDPWTVADLAYHVRMTMGRLPGMLAPPGRTRPGRTW